jgi:hypothetical protein
VRHHIQGGLHVGHHVGADLDVHVGREVPSSDEVELELAAWFDDAVGPDIDTDIDIAQSRTAGLDHGDAAGRALPDVLRRHTFTDGGAASHLGGGERARRRRSGAGRLQRRRRLHDAGGSRHLDVPRVVRSGRQWGAVDLAWRGIRPIRPRSGMAPLHIVV